MHFHQRCDIPDVNVNYCGCIIESTKEAKLLGIVVDNQLNWKPHTEQLCKRLSKSAYALFKLSRKVNRDVLITAYHGLVASALRYGVIFWGNSTNKEVVFKMQKKCIRSMCGIKQTDSCVPFFFQIS